MLEGWPLFFVGAAATAATVVFGRRQPLAWVALGGLFFLSRAPEFGVAAWVGAVVVLVWRIANPPSAQPPI